MRKLYTNVSLDPSSAFMVTYNDVQTQACANDEDTVTIGATEFIRLTDENGHNVSDGEGNQLLLNDGVIYKVVSGVPESTNVQVTDVITPTQYTLTINPTPADATVVLTATGFTQVGNSITVDAGTRVTYTVSKTGYVTATDSIVVNGDRSRSVVLEEEQPAVTYYRLTSEPTRMVIDGSNLQITSSSAYADYFYNNIQDADFIYASPDGTTDHELPITVDTSSMPAVEGMVDGETVNFAPIFVEDGQGNRFKVTQNSSYTDSPLYIRLEDLDEINPIYSQRLYMSADVFVFTELDISVDSESNPNWGD